MTTTPTFGFTILARDRAARCGQLTTAHGVVNTPAFIPVGTVASVKGMLSESVAATGAEIVLTNTYHLMLRPGAERIARLGGLHQFMNWPRPVLTDSGGYQIMSLAGFRELSNAGVIFRSHLDGSRHELTPERSIQIQEQLDADISMVLDECTPFPIEETKAVTSLDLSMRWAERSRSVFRPRPGYSLFGIVQGSIYPALRLRSAALLKEICFDGYAIGGLGVGESREIMFSTLDVTISALPEDKPRYLMGIGKPTDIVSAVLRGIDMFDCVIPTRSGRTGQAFTRQGALNLQNACHQDNPDPLDRNCNCPACSGYSRAYLHHLVKAREILGSVLLTWHNLHYYQDLMAQLRQAIRVGNLTRELMNATVPLDSCRFFEN